MRRVEKLNRNRVWSEISIVPTENALMRHLNAEFRGADTVTDVLSFAYPPECLEAPHRWIGEVFINAQLATQKARSLRWHADDEFALYLAHALDHLSGATDDNDTERHRMRRRELRWLADARKMGLVEGLFRHENTCDQNTPP